MPELTPLQRIEQVLAEAGVEAEGLAPKLIEAAAMLSEPSRRQLMGKCQTAFREGFLTGKKWPKFAPWASDVWRKSDFYLRNFVSAGENPAAEQRYARYNDLS